jgi:SAM-dependent methyltransferase
MGSEGYGPVLRRLRHVARRDPRLLALARRAKDLAAWRRVNGPPVGWVRFGSLRRLEPFDRNYGYGRGRPVDRYYIERFLEEHAADIRGRVLEIGDPTYAGTFGGARVTHLDVLDVASGNPRATVVADLSDAPHLPGEHFDCVLLPETIQVIWDVRAALATVHRILRPGGVVLATFPGITQYARHDAEAWPLHWCFTTTSARRLFVEAFPGGDVVVQAHGNVLAAAAYLYGLCDRDVRRRELDHHDPDYEVVVTVRAQRRAAAPGRAADAGAP